MESVLNLMDDDRPLRRKISSTVLINLAHGLAVTQRILGTALSQKVGLRPMFTAYWTIKVNVLLC
jgi:hypothetical protein